MCHLLSYCSVYCALFPVTRGCTLFSCLLGGLMARCHVSLSCVCGVFRSLAHISVWGVPLGFARLLVYSGLFLAIWKLPCVVGDQTIADCSRSTLHRCCKGLVCSLNHLQSRGQPTLMNKSISPSSYRFDVVE